MSLDARPEIRRRRGPSGTGGRTVLGLMLLALALLGLSFMAVGTPAVSATPPASAVPAVVASQSDQYGYCPSAGPVYWGVEWNCVAVLNLTVVLLMLGSVGLIAYVFRGSDAAELPGDSSTVPLTEEDWAAEQERRRDRLAAAPSESLPAGKDR